MKRIFLSLLIVLSVGLSFSPISVSANTREARVISSVEKHSIPIKKRRKKAM